MKVLILFFIFNFSAFGNYFKISEVESKNILKGWNLKSECGLDCIKIPYGYNKNYHKIIDAMKDDVSNPNYEAKSNIVACIDEADCISKEAAHTCPVSVTAYPYEVIRLANNTEVYCTKIVSFPQVLSGEKRVVEDVALKVAHDATEAASVTKENAIQFALKSIFCGKRVIATLLVQNAPKGLTKTQIKLMNKTYRDVKELLETGSLDSAREEIFATIADGVLITEADKTALVAELDSCDP